MKAYAQQKNQPQQQSRDIKRRSRARSKSARSTFATPAADHEVHPMTRLQRTIGNQGVQRLLRANAGSTRSSQRKCVACKEGTGLWPTCSQEETRMGRIVSSADATSVLTRKTEIPGEQKAALIQMKEVDAKPSQTVIVGVTKCGNEYGAKAKLTYAGTLGWWLKESIKVISDTCSKGKTIIDKTPGPIQNAPDADYFYDWITNSNGPPAKVAPCKTVTQQTVFLGPTAAKVEKFQYNNYQTIEVTIDQGKGSKSGKVITSVESDAESARPATCSWTS